MTTLIETSWISFHFEQDFGFSAHLLYGSFEHQENMVSRRLHIEIFRSEIYSQSCMQEFCLCCRRFNILLIIVFSLSLHLQLVLIESLQNGPPKEICLGTPLLTSILNSQHLQSRKEKMSDLEWEIVLTSFWENSRRVSEMCVEGQCPTTWEFCMAFAPCLLTRWYVIFK